MEKMTVTIREDMGRLLKVQKEVQLNGFDLYSKTGTKRNELLMSLTAQFPNGYAMDINVYPGEEYETGYIDLVLFDEHGQECTCALADGDNVIGKFEIQYENVEYCVRVFPERKMPYVFINRNVYTPDIDAEVTHTIAVDSGWLAYYLQENEEKGKRTITEYLTQYTSEDVERWFGAAVMEGAVAFSFSLANKELEWGTDDEWKAMALLDVMEQFSLSPAQMKAFLKNSKKSTNN